MQQQQLQQVIKTLKEANNVLITVKNSPTVDELSAAVGLTLALNKLNKHSTTVFSGSIPSTIEFLKPESVIETNTDSLRDFIIALDKSKADKLRYKVEDSVVRIFITPYRTSISEKDLEFSQGDFNVDVVMALGVVAKEDFDVAVTAHGNILHDATVIGVTKQGSVSTIGAVNWQAERASSISEMVATVVDGLGQDIIDGQMATAFLTGIVAETDRFKNEKTTPEVLAIGSRLMSAGANQQLIAEKLDQPLTSTQPLTKLAHQGSKPNDDGSLEIEHKEDAAAIHIDDQGNLHNVPSDSSSAPEDKPSIVQRDGPQDLQTEEVKRSYIETSTNQLTELPAEKISQPSLEDNKDLPMPSRNASTPQQSEKSTEIDKIEQTSGSNMPVMQHGHKVIEPLGSIKEENSRQTSKSKGTLADLEDSIGSIHSSGSSTTAQDKPMSESANQKASPETANSDNIQQPPKVSEQQQPIINAPRPQPLADVDTESKETHHQDNNNPPEVPPPLVPPTAPQPQFYDAEGNNNNPFLNPSS